MVWYELKDVNLESVAEREALVRLYRCGVSHRGRQRAQAILLSARGHRVDALAALFELNRDTVSFWLERWVGRKTDESAEGGGDVSADCVWPLAVVMVGKEGMRSQAHNVKRSTISGVLGLLACVGISRINRRPPLAVPAVRRRPRALRPGWAASGIL